MVMVENRNGIKIWRLEEADLKGMVFRDRLPRDPEGWKRLQEAIKARRAVKR